METRIRRMLFKTCVGIVLISCCMSGVACDVPDDVVYTDLHKSVRIGDSVVLKCQFRGTPLAVYWKKGYDPNRAPNLVSWIPTDDVTGTCFGKRPCRIMEMNEDRSLVIKEVSIAEQGRYICKVANYKEKMIHNLTDINVFSPPKKPYPFINECLGSPDMKSNRTCIISTTEDPINISCTASGYFPDLDLFFLHGSQYITALNSEETTNEDGKKTKSITSQASSSLEPYMCVASDIPGVGGRRVSSVLVTTATATASVDPPDSTLAVKIVVPLVISLLVAVVLGAIIRWHIRQHDPVSYVELWKLVDEGDLAEVENIVNKLVGNPEGNMTKADLYRILCEWKDESSGNVRLLYRAIKQLGFHDDLKRMKDFRASTSVSVSDDDLAHICWHVRSCKEETVNPILRALHSTDRQGRRPIFSTYNSFADDLQVMKGWKSWPVQETMEFYSGSEEISIQVGSTLAKSDMQEMLQNRMVDSPAGNDEDDGMTPGDPILGKVHLEVKTSPPNQMIRLCLALEEAGKTADKQQCPVYLQLAKTFFQIEDEYKSALTDEVLKEFGLSLTKPHSQRLGNILGLPKDTIADRNEDDLGVIFRTNAMLMDWVSKQKCSYYDIRCRLRRSAERCNRQDIADVFIPKDQSIIMPPMGPDFLTGTDDNRRPRSSVHDDTFLLPFRTNNISFDEEFIELAFRLVMSDVHPFAEDLGISDQLLTYTPKFKPTQLYQGTISMLKAVESKDRSEMVEVLKTAGYSEEAAAKYFDPISFVELWKLVDEGDLAKVQNIVNKLVGNQKGNMTKADLYRILCEWKDGSSRNVRSLYRAIKQLGFHDDLKRIKDFRASTSVLVSDDDLAHICWHVRSCEEETVNPILRALYSPDRQGGSPVFSTSKGFDDDLRMMKTWKSGSIPETVEFHSGSEEISIQVGSALSTPENHDEDDEMTPMDPVLGEVHLKVKTSPPNQMIRLCLALEEAGKTADEHHRPVYLQLAKTFSQKPVSYVELWKLVDEGDLAKVKDIVSKLVGNLEGNKSREDLYKKMCDWKEESSGSVRSLYRAIKELGFLEDLKRIKDFRACASVSVSDDDLAHICWHVCICEEETVNPILQALYFPDRQGGRPIFSTCNSFDDNLQLMKRWKSGSMPETVTFRSGSEEISMQVRSTLSAPDRHDIPQSRRVDLPAGNHDEDNEMTPMDPVSGEVHLKVKTSPPNQKMRLCLALEEAGNTIDEYHRPVYLQLAKTYFQIRDEYKSAFTVEVLKHFALSLTKRHCQKLGNKLNLPESVIDATNEEDLGVIFRTDDMLRDWESDQKCSYYEMRRKMRQAAERCNRHDVADCFIPKDQSSIMSLVRRDNLTRTDDNQCPRNSGSDGDGDMSHDKLNRIGGDAVTETLPEFGGNYESREVLEQQTSDKSGREEQKKMSFLKTRVASCQPRGKSIRHVKTITSVHETAHPMAITARSPMKSLSN